MVGGYLVGFASEHARRGLSAVLARSSPRRRTALAGALRMIEKTLSNNPQVAGFPHPTVDGIRIVSQHGVVVIYKVQPTPKRVIILRVSVHAEEDSKNHE